MTALVVVGCILLALALIGQVRIGAAVSWSEDGLSLRLKLGPARISIFPAQKKKEPRKEKTPKKEKKRKKRPKEGPAPEEKPKKSFQDTLSMAVQLLSLLAETAGRMKRKIRIDWINLHIIWGASDPAAAAMGYGAGNAVAGMLWPLIDHTFRVKEREVRIDVDFQRKTPAAAADAQATLTVGQSLALALRTGVRAIKIYLGHRRGQTKQKAVQV